MLTNAGNSDTMLNCYIIAISAVLLYIRKNKAAEEAKKDPETENESLCSPEGV